MAKTLIVGANRGIGLALCKCYLDKGDEVFATYRSDSGELDSLNATSIAGIDTTDVATLAKLEPFGSFDTVIVNAGIMRASNLQNLNTDDIKTQFEVNALGPLQTAATLSASINKNGKLGLITSRMGSIEDNSSGGSYGYRMSKAALNAAGKSLAIDLKEKSIAVALLHPGYVRTAMTGDTGHLHTDESAAMLQSRVEQLTLETSGSFWHANGQILPW